MVFEIQFKKDGSQSAISDFQEYSMVLAYNKDGKAEKRKHTCSIEKVILTA